MTAIALPGDGGTPLAPRAGVSSRHLREIVAAALTAVAAAAGAEPPGARWLRLEAPAGVDRAEAVAIEPGTGRLAIGGERGVALGPLEGALERVLSRGPVRDLAFADGGALLAATDAGLYWIDGPGRVRSEPIGAGDAARSVRALAVAAGRIVAGTDAGVFERDATSGLWQRVRGLPFGQARRVALVGDERGASVVWASIDGALWSASAQEGGRQVSLPDEVHHDEGPIDVANGAPGELLVVLARSLAIRSAAGVWRSEPLELPPGALPLRIVVEPGRWWLATDSGLLVASGPGAPWQRCGPPAGHVAVAALAGTGNQLVVATAHGLLRQALVSTAAHVESSPASAARPLEPTVGQVQQKALRYLALEPRRMQELWQGAGRRGWYPELTVRGDYGRDDDDGLSHDEAFISGETHHLVDRDHNRGEDYAVSLALSWDLGDVAFNLDRIDVSREARLVDQLRDDVLDEINQLYFERQRVLASLADPVPDAPVALLRLRAAELASGLDAWTGGWFSAQIAPAVSDGPSFPAQESSP